MLEELPAGQVQLGGLYEKAPLIMKAELDKLTILRPFGLGHASPSTLPLFGEVLTPFAELADRWFDLSAGPRIRRVALGGVVMTLFREIEACRSAMNDYLPAVDMQVAEVREFLYRDNRQRRFECASDLVMIVSRSGRSIECGRAVAARRTTSSWRWT